MELNGVLIRHKSTLSANFSPFEGVWRNLENGNYMECLSKYFSNDPLAQELLGMAGFVLVTSADSQGQLEQKRSSAVYRKFSEENSEAMHRLEAIAENEKQKWILCLAVYMHVQAEQEAFAPETARYISKLLREAATPGPAECADVFRSRLCLINGEGYCLDQSGTITPCQNSCQLPFGKGWQNIQSFAYTDRLGLIAIDADGKVLRHGGSVALQIPTDRKMVCVSAYLSNYILLDERGEIHTNIRMDLSGWRNLRYVYVGLNSAAGVKRDGTIVSAGVQDLSALAGAARVFTYHGQERHFFVIFENGSAQDDECVVYTDVTAAALTEKGYYYAKTDGWVYQRSYGRKEEPYTKLPQTANEILPANDGLVYCL